MPDGEAADDRDYKQGCAESPVPPCDKLTKRYRRGNDVGKRYLPELPSIGARAFIELFELGHKRILVCRPINHAPTPPSQSSLSPLRPARVDCVGEAAIGEPTLIVGTQAEGLGDLEVDDQLELGGLLDGQVGRFAPLTSLSTNPRAEKTLQLCREDWIARNFFAT
jgi:hypothetical protein